MIRRVVIGAGSAVLVVLLARSLAYATQPGPTARVLEHRAGGPALPLLALVTLALAAGMAVAVCALAALAVRERAFLTGRPAERFDIRRALAVAFALTAVTSVGGGLLEAYVHWRAGLGWHGLHCLLGPVHRELLPFEAGLSFVAAAVLAAARHVLAWMQRTFARLAAVPLCVRLRVPRASRPSLLHTSGVLGAAAARAPPVGARR